MTSRSVERRLAVQRGGREHGLLYVAPMVRAILDGTKLQTRRPVTRLNTYLDGGPMPRGVWPHLRLADAWVDRGPSPMGNAGPYLKAPRAADGDEYVHRLYSHYQPGDLMWARETWSPDHASVYPCWPVVYRADPHAPTPEDTREHVPRCTGAAGGPERADCLACAGFKWRPSIHMPRWAARIVRPIVSVRVERVQDISEEDARAEGVRPISFVDQGESGPFCGYAAGGYVTAREMFGALWRETYGESWERNDWVWAITFASEART